MNKYQEDLGRIARLKLENGKVAEDFLPKTFKELQELIDKSIPQKVIKTTRKEYMKHGGYKHKCPNCGNMVGTITERLEIDQDDYCCSCGQRLDYE